MCIGNAISDNGTFGRVENKAPPKWYILGVCDQNNPDRVQITITGDLKLKDLSFRDLIVEYYQKRRELLNLGYKITQLREINNI